MDDYHKEIVGYAVHETLETQGCLSALDMALKGTARKRTQRLIHHSDRGVQYASSAYVTKLKSNGIEVSMTENGNPKENAASERVNNTIKMSCSEGKDLPLSGKSGKRWREGSGSTMRNGLI